jgi:hypothetical protein
MVVTSGLRRDHLVRKTPYLFEHHALVLTPGASTLQLLEDHH